MDNFKEKISKHEELINKYKELYMNENNKSLNESSNNRNNIIILLLLIILQIILY